MLDEFLEKTYKDLDITFDKVPYVIDDKENVHAAALGRALAAMFDMHGGRALEKEVRETVDTILKVLDGKRLSLTLVALGRSVGLIFAKSGIDDIDEYALEVLFCGIRSDVKAFKDKQ